MPVPISGNRGKGCGTPRGKLVATAVVDTQSRRCRLQALLLCLWVVFSLGGEQGEATAPMPCLRDGDVNEDSRITPDDVVQTLQIFLGLAEPSPCQRQRANVLGDVDGSITAGDARCLLQHFLAQPSCLSVRLEIVTSRLADPVFITHAGDERLFVVERPGRIRILRQGVLDAVPFLDITSLVSDLVNAGEERGLLSVAFHPHYRLPDAAGAGLLWVNYTDRQGDTVIARYTVSPTTPDQADSASALELLHVDQPFPNHNGGQLQFGPEDGLEHKRYLYIGMGDGGFGGDPSNHAQNDASLLGKILRLDPSVARDPLPPFYQIPPDNPRPTADFPLATIWAKGLRNPWRFSFDASRGDLYIADVGQDRWEEVNVSEAGTPGGVNYGWRIMEGPECFIPSSGCDQQGLTLPIFAYAHGESDTRCAIIGGYVYRGQQVPALAGSYVYADLCSGEVFGLTQVTPGVWHNRLILRAAFHPLTFGVDSVGELYIGGADGNLYRFVSGEP